GRNGQVGREHGVDGVDLEALGGGDGNDIGEIGELADGQQRLGDLVLGNEVDLRHQGHDRRPAVEEFELGGDVSVARTDRLVGGQTEADDVDFVERRGHEVV